MYGMLGLIFTCGVSWFFLVCFGSYEGLSCLYSWFLKVLFIVGVTLLVLGALRAFFFGLVGDFGVFYAISVSLLCCELLGIGYLGSSCCVGFRGCVLVW